MENQHRKISGYRKLAQAEIDLINEIKAEGERLAALLHRVSEHLFLQRQAAGAEIAFMKEREHLLDAEPGRWLELARTDLQNALMKLARAVAQPEGF